MTSKESIEGKKYNALSFATNKIGNFDILVSSLSYDHYGSFD
jgi:hypothetical protein